MYRKTLWTGLSTEMDKIGNVGDSNSGDFYTRNDWGGLSTRTEKRIDFVFDFKKS